MSSQNYSAAYFKKFDGGSYLKRMLVSEIDRKGPVWRALRKQFSPKSKLLDVGCGNGVFLKTASNYFDAVGIDFSQDALKLAQKNAPQAKFIHGSIEALNQITPHSFDIITCFDVLEHVDQYSEFLTEFARLIKPDGWIIISVPNTGSLMRQWRGKHWWAYEDPTHISLKSRPEWIQLFSNHGFQVSRLWSSGFINHPLPSYSLPKKYLLHHYATQIIGLTGITLPSPFSDVDFFLITSNPGCPGVTPGSSHLGRKK